MEIILEDIREKFDLVLEGHSSLHKRIDKAEQNLNDKISLVDFKVDTLHQRVENVREELVEKIDNVAEDLAAHRADTESHRKGYKVSDG